MQTETAEPSTVPEVDGPVVSLTAGAIQQLRRMQTDNNMPGYGLRFGLQGGGCSGYTYELEFEEAPQPEDEVLLFEDVRVFLNPLHREYLKGSVVDYKDELIGAGFHIENPNVKRTCGCGTSFDV